MDKAEERREKNQRKEEIRLKECKALVWAVSRD
jgi:hypothetical protein